MSEFKVSISSLGTYETCPRKYKYQYIDRLPRQSFEHLDVGNYVHEVLEYVHTDIASASTDLDIEQVVRKHAKERWEGFKTKLGAESQVKSKTLLKDYISHIKRVGLPEVLATEQEFQFEVEPGLIMRGIIDRIDRLPDGRLGILDYKGLALDTPIPTPDGWSTMADLKVGDCVFGSDGRPTRVTLKSQVHNRPCYRLTMSDHSSVVCDNVHLWKVGYRSSGSNGNYDEVINAEELHRRFANLRPGDTGSFVIENSEPLEGADADLPIDPWLLGAWLGDGFSKTGAISVGRQELEEAGLLKNKNIPIKYLRASLKQRQALLQGLMDTDGSWNPQRKRAVFVSANKELAQSATQLIRSFGITVQSFTATDKHGHVSYRLEFRPVNGINPFRLPKKAKQVDIFMSETQTRSHLAKSRTITSVTPVASVPTQCISVDAADSLYLCGEGMIVTHNTGKSKYLDRFQIEVYGLHLVNAHPETESFVGTYLVLPEGPKEVTYDIKADELVATKQEIISQATNIVNDKTWDPKPTRLCNYCDFYAVCPDAYGKRSQQNAELVAIGKRTSF